MDVKTAVEGLIPGTDVSFLGKCIDTLLKADYADPSIFPKLAPFLGQNLLEQRVIDYAMEPGVDITDNYFILWEPLLRGKAALLISSIVDRCEKIPDVSEVYPLLYNILIKERDSQDIEQIFAFLAITSIGLKNPSVIMTNFSDLCKFSTAIVNYATNSTNPNSLYRSLPFLLQVYETFLDFVSIKGVLDDPDNMQRMIAAGMAVTLTQIALKAEICLTKKPAIIWNMISAFLRIVTEHPNGNQFFDLDRLPRPGDEVVQIMRLALSDRGKAGNVRNAIATVSKENRTADRFKELAKYVISK